MISPAGGIETDVGPVAKVAELPYGDVVGSAVVGFEGVGTGEGLEKELVALGFGHVDTMGVGGNDIVALLVVVVAEKVRLFCRG